MNGWWCMDGGVSIMVLNGDIWLAAAAVVVMVVNMVKLIIDG